MRTLAVPAVLLAVALAGMDSPGRERANDWQPWSADLDPPQPGSRPAPALTADYFPHKPGTTRTETQTFFDDGKPGSVTVKRSEQRDKGVIASRVVKLMNSGGTVSSPDLFPESTTAYEVKDGFVRVGYPEDAKKPDSPVKWFQVLKVGAKPGDRWSSVPGKTEPDTEYKAAGAYKGKPCAVIAGERSYTIFVEGFGKALYRSYTKKGEKLIISMEVKHE